MINEVQEVTTKVPQTANMQVAVVVVVVVHLFCRFSCRQYSEVRKRAGFQKGWFLADVPWYQKPERGYIWMFPGTKNRNEGTFAKPPFLENRPFVSTREMIGSRVIC